MKELTNNIEVSGSTLIRLTGIARLVYAPQPSEGHGRPHFLRKVASLSGCQSPHPDTYLHFGQNSVGPEGLLLAKPSPKGIPSGPSGGEMVLDTPGELNCLENSSRPL